MMISLVGSNSFALHKRLKELVDEFVKKHGDLALERIDGEEADLQAVLDAVQNLPFLAERKMVIVRNLGANKQAAEKIEQIIGASGDDTDLILYEQSVDKRTAYFKVLKSKTQLEELNELDAQHLVKWLVNEASLQGGTLENRDAQFLVERVGADQALLANELEKLLTYEPKITRANIELLTEPNPQSKIFDLLDAAFSGNKKRALQLYEEQRIQKVEPQAILALIVWQLQLLTITKLGEGKADSQIAKDAGMSPYPISKAARLSYKLSTEDIKKMVTEAFRIDLRSKTSALDLDEALKTYIATL